MHLERAIPQTEPRQTPQQQKLVDGAAARYKLELSHLDAAGAVGETLWARRRSGSKSKSNTK